MMMKSGLGKIFLKFLHALTMSFSLLNFDQKYKFSNKNNMIKAWRNFKNVFLRPLFIIMFTPEMLKFHPYSILTGDTIVELVIYHVLSNMVVQVVKFSSGGYKIRKIFCLRIKIPKESYSILRIVVVASINYKDFALLLPLRDT